MKKILKNPFLIILFVVCVLAILIAIQTAKGMKVKENSETTTRKDEQETNINENDIPDRIVNAEIATGVLRFAGIDFEIGDKLFKFEDVGFGCRENDFDTKVKAGETAPIALYATVQDSNKNTNIEYIYLICYNSSDEKTEIRNCELVSIKDDSSNKTYHIEAPKGITYGMTRQELLKIYGEKEPIKTVNNSDVYCYKRKLAYEMNFAGAKDVTQICLVYINKATDLVEKIEFDADFGDTIKVINDELDEAVKEDTYIE